MFSLDNYYEIFKKNFLKLKNIKTFLCKQNINDINYTTSLNDYDNQDTQKKLFLFDTPEEYNKYFNNSITFTPQMLFLCCEQEPLYFDVVDHLYKKVLPTKDFKHKQEILINSEFSEEKNQILETFSLKDWYFFYHGLAALFWYNDLRYLPNSKTNKTKVFSCYNHLISGFRSYRLYLVSLLDSQHLLELGSVSCSLEDQFGSWKQSVKTSFLSKSAKQQIFQTFSNLDNPLIADQDYIHGQLSANIDFNDMNSCFWHIVTETVFFQDKLHLTEKVFKPIVNRLPFILVAAKGNLAYLKSYGFRTFDRWIDESYDLEQDPEKRINLIVNEINKLCKLSTESLEQINNEMQEILDYNYNWFYTGFKELVINEMVDNYNQVLNKLDVNTADIDFDAIKNRLKQ